MSVEMSRHVWTRVIWTLTRQLFNGPAYYLCWYSPFCSTSKHNPSISAMLLRRQTCPSDTKNIYLEMPKNFVPSDGFDCVLKLKKSLCGSTIAPRLWYEKLKHGLIQWQFKVSDINPCMFIRKNCIIQTYVDNLVIHAPKQQTIDQLLDSFHNDGDEYN